MAVVETTNLGLSKQDNNENIGTWDALERQDRDRLEARLTTQYAGDPNGFVVGSWVGQLCTDTTNDNQYVCTTTGIAASAVWTQQKDYMQLSRIAGSTYSTIQDLQSISHSAGVSTGGDITDDTDGTITVAAGTGTIRATNSNVAELLFMDWAAESGVNVALIDNDMNYIYVEYNSGSPRVVATSTKRTDAHTNVLLGTVYRLGTDLHVSNYTKTIVSDHAREMVLRMHELNPFARVSGGIISEVGTRNIAVTAGDWWEGLTEFSTAAFDSSVADTFRYYYSDGASGFTEVLAQTTIDNLQYDDGSGTLATLSNAKYGVYWLYLGQEGHVYIMYGTINDLLTVAQDAPIPAALPPHFAEAHARLLGKVIILKSAATFTSIQSAFNGVFSLESAADHGNLVGLTDDDHTQYSLISSQAGAPSSTPTRVGEINIDTTADTVYVATDTASSADWTIANSLATDTTPLLIADLDCNGNDLLEAQRPDATNAGTAITLALTDVGKYLRLTAATAITITVPPNSTVAFPINTEIDFVGYGAGVVTFAEGAGVTIRSKSSLLSIAGQYAGSGIKKIATDEWILVGALV